MNTAATLPAEFIAFWKNTMEQAHTITGAHWSLIGRWEAGYSIPGYGTWREFFFLQYPERTMPEKCPRDFKPRGWSLRNLSRFQLTQTERLMRRLRRQSTN